MANVRISDLTDIAAAPASGDLIELVDVSDTTDAATGTNKKVTYSDFISGISIPSTTINDVYVTLSRDGTGTYDADGTDDEVQFDLAFADANTNGKTLLILPGTYSIEGSDLASTNVQVVCMPGVIFNKTTTTSTFTQSALITNLKWYGGVFTSNDTDGNVFALSSFRNAGMSFNEMKFSNSIARGLALDGYDLFVDKCIFEEHLWAISNAKFLDSTDDRSLTITNCKFQTSADVTASPTYDTEYGEAIEYNVHGKGLLKIDKCEFEGYVEESIDANCSEAHISDTCITVGTSTGKNTYGITFGSGEITDSSLYTKGSISGVTIRMPTAAATANLFGVNIPRCDGMSISGLQVEAADTTRTTGLRVTATCDHLSIDNFFARNCNEGIDNLAGVRTTQYGNNLRFDGCTTDISDSSNQSRAIFFFNEPFGSFNAPATNQLSSDTTAEGGTFRVPIRYNATKVSFEVTAVAVAGTVKLKIYDVGGNELFEVESGTISGTGSQTINLPSTYSFEPGMYGAFLVPSVGTDITIRSYDSGSALNSISGEPETQGNLTVTSYTLPSSISYSSLSASTDKVPVLRFD